MTNLVLNGDFETAGDPPAKLIDWSVGQVGTALMPHVGRSRPLPLVENWAARFNGGDAEPNAILSQILSTQPGVTYQLSFKFHKDGSGPGEASLNVKVEGTDTLLDTSVRDNRLDGNSIRIGDLNPFVYEFVADGSSVILNFTDTSNGTISFDAMLDDVAVVAINYPPIAVSDSASTTANTSVAIRVLDNDSDLDNDPLTLSIAANPSNGSVFVDEDFINYIPNEDFTGQDSFRYQIDDGNGGTDTATVTVEIAIAGVNDRPIATNDRPLPGSEFVVPGIFGITSNSTANLIEVLANDSDPDGDSLTITAVTAPVNGGTAAVNGNAIEYTPAADFFGQDRFEYTISDGNGGTDTATVVVAVVNGGAPTATNDRPAPGTPNAVPGIFGITVNVPANIEVLANDIDPDGDVLSIISVEDPANGTASIDDNGTPDNTADDFILYTPADGFAGKDKFDYTISDGNGNTDTATIVASVNLVDTTDLDDTVIGSNEDDIINGRSGNDTLNGGDGNDTIRGQDGNDIINGGAGNDNLQGGSGDDTLNGGDGNDSLSGGLGDDTLIGEGGNDRLQGRQGSDILNGGAGADTLIGVKDDIANPGLDDIDVLTGGSESDRFVLGNPIAAFYLGNGASDFAEITDFEDGIDTIELPGAIGDYAIADDGTDTRISIGGDLVATVSGVLSANLTDADFTFI